MDGVLFIAGFISAPNQLFDVLRSKIVWDERMKARKTASFGVAYNYSQINYLYQEFIPELLEIVDNIEDALGFRPNNCLINYYMDGGSSMGFHSDQTDILEGDTGIAILSIGAERILRFRKIGEEKTMIDHQLTSGSLIYMSQQVQSEWQHAIPKSETREGRMSLTFRKIKGNY